MLQLSRDERIANARKKLQEFKSKQNLSKNSSENGIPSEGNDVIHTVSTDQISHPGANGSINDFDRLLSSIPSVPTQQQDISSPSQSAKHVLNISESQNAAAVGFLNAANFFRDQQNIDQSGFSFTSEITTAVTEKAAQISQEINHMLGANFDNANQNIIPEGNGGNKASRSTSHLSLPNSWQGNVRASPSASSVLIRELQLIILNIITALSRAMEQNASLKDQLTRLQDALDIAKKTNKEAEIELAELRSNKSEGIDTVLILGQIADSNLQAVPSLMSEEEKRRMEIELEAERAAASEARLKIAELEAKIASTQLESAGR
ncbi:hypothetical protein Aperf_G00000054237 [Anoplocephala perfoliata]